VASEQLLLLLEHWQDTRPAMSAMCKVQGPGLTTQRLNHFSKPSEPNATTFGSISMCHINVLGNEFHSNARKNEEAHQ
jgi:hypothetical protein